MRIYQDGIQAEQHVLDIFDGLRYGSDSNFHWYDCSCDECKIGPHNFHACMNRNGDCPYCTDVAHYTAVIEVSFDSLMTEYKWFYEDLGDGDYNSDFVKIYNICSYCNLPTYSKYLDNICADNHCSCCGETDCNDCDICNNCNLCSYHGDCECVDCDKCGDRVDISNAIGRDYAYICHSCYKRNRKHNYSMGDVVKERDLGLVTEGWLSPSGVWYYVPCYRVHEQGHGETARKLGYAGEDACEKAGYIHISSYYDEDDPFVFIPSRPTNAQKYIVNLYCKAHGLEIPESCWEDDYAEQEVTDIKPITCKAYIGLPRQLIDQQLAGLWNLSSALLGD